MPALLACHDLAKTHHGRPLFRGLSLSLHAGERVGLVGPNGAGKSTLLRLLAGEDLPDEGTVALQSGARLGFVAQEDAFEPGVTARQAVEAALAATPLEPEQRAARAQVTLGKAGFGEPGAPPLDLEAAKLSGGWRKRLAICRALALEPDVLLLDEPTNHLDLDGILWLERLLQRPSCAFLMVSHDRYLLDAVTTVMIEIDPRLPVGFLRCEGSYSDLVERREALIAAQRGEQKALEQRLEKVVAFLKKTPREQRKKSASKFTQAEEMSARLADVARRNSHGEAVELGFAATGRRTQSLVTAKGLGHTLGGQRLFHDLSFGLGPGDRLGVLGPNGSGKSTLLRILAGQIAPAEGALRTAQGLRVAWFDQERSQLDPDQTLRRALAGNGEQVTFGGKALHVTAWAARFLFPPEQLEMHVRRLSGGEKARVLLAQLMLQPADLLVLDEPTNDLDIPSLEVLEESLLEFPGAVALVTHDRHLLDRVATAILGLGLGDGGRLQASVEQWARARGEHLKREAAARQAAKPAPASSAPPARRVKLSTREAQELEGMEQAIGATEARAAELQAELERPGLPPARMQEAARELAEAQARVEALFARWQELEAKKAGQARP